MNGTQYMKPRFTLPASDNASQLRWDFGTLSKKEFKAKYPILSNFYQAIADGSMRLN